MEVSELAGWGALIGPVLGAAAALVGVAITQRAQRRSAHEARVWDRRADLYVDVLSWIRRVRDQVPASPPVRSVAVLVREVEDQKPNLRAFASERVYVVVTETASRIDRYDMLLAFHKHPDLSAATSAVRAGLDELERVIGGELQPRSLTPRSSRVRPTLEERVRNLYRWVFRRLLWRWLNRRLVIEVRNDTVTAERGEQQPRREDGS